MKNKDKSTGASLGEALRNLSNLLTLLFCALRSCDVITWEWYWVISPLIISEVIGIIALIVAGAIAINIVTKDK
ncbi:MAG: hypothetical protein J6J18_05795 [Oscillospiraceae bacterium]|nr:hypothetical protein [Oscillospiraceae bacterium]